MSAEMLYEIKYGKRKLRVEMSASTLKGILTSLNLGTKWIPLGETGGIIEGAKIEYILCIGEGSRRK